MKKQETFLEEGKMHKNEKITKARFLGLKRRHQNQSYISVIALWHKSSVFKDATKVTGMRNYSHVSSYPFACFLYQECMLLTLLYVTLSMKFLIVINTWKLCLCLNSTKIVEDPCGLSGFHQFIYRSKGFNHMLVSLHAGK